MPPGAAGQPQRAERRGGRGRLASPWPSARGQIAAGLAHLSRPAASPGARRPTARGQLFVNDSKATNADSGGPRAGLLRPRGAGSRAASAKEGGIEPAGAAFFPRIAKAFLIGRDAPSRWPRRWPRMAWRTEIVGTLDARDARGRHDAAFAGGAPVVLLSPACASWDQFTGFDARGDRFRDLAQRQSPRRAARTMMAFSPRRHLRPRPLVVDGRSLDARRAAGAGRLRLRDDARRLAGGGGAHRRILAPHVLHQAGRLPDDGDRADGLRLAADPARGAAASRWLGFAAG
jgi:hypothetical protein